MVPKLSLVARLLMGSMLLITVLPACTPTASCTWETIDRPVIVSPAWDEVIDTLNPTLTWTYADADCPASRFEVSVGTDELDLAIGGGVTYTTTTTSITWPDTLEPATTYYWTVSPVVATAGGEVVGPPADAVYPFNTNPLCGPDANILPPFLLIPVDGSIVTRSDGFGFYWDDPTSCIPGPYTLEISRSPDFSDVFSFPGERRTSLGVYSDSTFSFEDCARYYWRVYATLDDGSQGPYADVKTFVIQTGAVACVDGATPTLVPSPTPVTPIAMPLNNAACRAGPGMDYAVLGYLDEGEEYPVIGRNDAGTWWLVQLNEQVQCWVYGELVMPGIDPAQVQVVQVEPPPVTATDEPVDCSQYNTNPAACNANQACQWVLTQQYPNGVCINR